MISKKSIVLGFMFCFVRLNAMISKTEVHPFMLSTVDQPLQSIKGKKLAAFTDYTDPEIIAVGAVFKAQLSQGKWIYGTWEDGSQWKANSRCGLGLFLRLVGKTKAAMRLIQKAADEDGSSWARYYMGFMELISGGNIDLAFDHFQRAHKANPEQIPAHWYRHLMTVSGWQAEQQKNNWMVWFEELNCKRLKHELSYPLSLYARLCNDNVGAEMLCLRDAATHSNMYRANAINVLYHYTIRKQDGTMHPQAQEATDILLGNIDPQYVLKVIHKMNPES